jgi:hypothetical protein
MHADGWGLTHTEMGEYNVFQLNRMPVDDERADVVYIFEGRVFDSRMQYTRAVYRNIEPLQLDLYAGHVANLGRPADYIMQACGLFIRNHSDASQEAQRSICFDIMGYIGQMYGRRPGAALVDNHTPTAGHMATWRQNGGLPDFGLLAWVLPRLQHLPINTRRSISLLYDMCLTQFFDPLHPSKINLDDLGGRAADTARAIHFHSATHRTLRRLRRHATTGSFEMTQIVAIFVGAAGPRGALSFFFVCSPHRSDASDRASIIRLMLSVARTQSFALLEPHVAVPFSERVSLAGFVAPLHVAAFNAAAALPVLNAPVIPIAAFAHHGIHNEFVRYLRAFFWPPHARD